MKAVDVIKDAFERCNRLSAGETLGDDDIALGFRRLNLLVDELSAQDFYLYRNVLTSAAQSGNITLGADSWAAILPGDTIVSATCNNIAMAPITMRQYNELYNPTSTGAPTVWAQDGLATVYLWPVPTGQTIKLQTRAGVAQFADLTTDYTVPDGYTSAMGAALAVRIAPNVVGRVPPELLLAERKLMGNVSKVDPAINNVRAFTGNGYLVARPF